MAPQDEALPGTSGQTHDDDTRYDTFSSPISTPMTRGSESHAFMPLADQTFTPLSFVDDPSTDNGSSATLAERSGVPEKDTNSMPVDPVTAGLQGAPSEAFSGHSAEDAIESAAEAVKAALDAATAAVSAPGSPIAATRGRLATDISEPCVDHFKRASRVIQGSESSRDRDQRNRDSIGHENYRPRVPVLKCATQGVTGTAPSSVSPEREHGHIKGRRLRHDDNIDKNTTSPRYSRDHPSSILAHARDQYPQSSASTSSPLSDFFPLRTGSVQPDTQLAQPRPIIRTNSLAIRHPFPDVSPRSASYAGSIAQLEAAAERLSMTSSIDDAIRDLHSELKRSDSRRSSILAANLRRSPVDDNNSNTASSAVGQLSRHLSNSSSIVSTNIAARHGGYSPAAFVKSPNHSLTGSRLRSGSKNSSGRPEIDLDSLLSRHGPGKASIRSVRSNKMSLAEISESEPVGLTKDAFDKADSAPPLRSNSHERNQKPVELEDANVANTDVFHKMMGDDDFMERTGADHGTHHSAPHRQHQHGRDVPQRPSSSHSNNTFQQCQDAFGDFDGVHWVPEHDNDPYAPPSEFDFPTPRMPPPAMARPQSYMDPESGQNMLYYPARVPAMLNLPPKLSNKPKAAVRNNRRSKVLSMMMDGQDEHNNRQSRQLEQQEQRDTTRDSWLPDPLAGQRNSFAALSSDGLNFLEESHSVREGQPAAQAEAEAEAEPLRRPERLSQMDSEKRASKMARLENLPPQLRASAFFDIPSTSPEIEVKDGSAMATLDSILDASATAPVSAFTDHRHGKLGGETYGKEKKRASLAPSAALRPTTAEAEPKKRSSFSWFKRDKKHQKAKSDTAAEDETGATENQAAVDSDGESIDEGQLDDELDEEVHGAPTTLLAELQIRKKHQQNRTQMFGRTDPDGMHATLLEMDAVAETQKKARQGKRVNLAWEDPDAHADQNGSDDEDVPLALLAAKNPNVHSMLDINRPIGLMERREMEENEPLSHRKARLNGQDPREYIMAKRQSMMNLSAPAMHHARSRSTLSRQASTPEPDEDEVPGETLAERRRRLAAKDEAENPLPKTRPVSSVFSAELLSQFDFEDHDAKKAAEAEAKETEKGKEAANGDGEETLGQRRRRLQSEREARELEMGYNNLDGTTAPPPNERISLANVLGAHPKKGLDLHSQEEKRRMEEHKNYTRERDAKMAAMRSQMPVALTGPNITQSGGFRSGQFNDGTGGLGPLATKSSPAIRSQAQGPQNLQHRASAVFSPYGAPPMQQAQQVPYGGMAAMNPYSGGTMNAYGGGMVQPGMQVPLPGGGSMDRVERWRQSVLP